MHCPDCGADAVAFAVPADLREYLPEGTEGAALCAECLRVHPADEPDGAPDFAAVSDAFPTSEDAAVPMALLVGLLSSLALYREEISALVARVEAAGADPLLVVDRLATDPTLSPAADLERRRHQLEQLL